jgi:hypothetical protein
LFHHAILYLRRRHVDAMPASRTDGNPELAGTTQGGSIE